MTPLSRGHTQDPMSTDALASHTGSKSVDILSKSGKLCSCNFAIVIKEWENPNFLHHYALSVHSNTPGYARLSFKSTHHASGNVKGRFTPTVQSSITYLYPLAIETANNNHAPPSRNATRNQLLVQSLKRPHTGKQSTKLSSTQLPTKEMHCHLPSCHHACTDVHLHMQIHQRQVCSICQCSNLHNDSHPTHRHEGANHVRMAIKYGTLPEKAPTAMLWSQAPMQRVTQALINATKQLYKYGQPIALTFNVNNMTIVEYHKDYIKYYYKDYAHPLCMPARGKYVAIPYQVNNVKRAHAPVMTGPYTKQL